MRIHACMCLRVCMRLGQFFRGISACVGPRGSAVVPVCVQCASLTAENALLSCSSRSKSVISTNSIFYARGRITLPRVSIVINKHRNFSLEFKLGEFIYKFRFSYFNSLKNKIQKDLLNDIFHSKVHNQISYYSQNYFM